MKRIELSFGDFKNELIYSVYCQCDDLDVLKMEIDFKNQKKIYTIPENHILPFINYISIDIEEKRENGNYILRRDTKIYQEYIEMINLLK